MMKYSRILFMAGLFVLGLFLASCDRVPILAPPEDRTIDGGVDIELTGERFATLTVTRCVNVDIVDCSIRNLVLEECMNVDVTGCAFNGSGTAVTTNRCIMVSITDSRFSPRYDQRLSETMSMSVEIE